jgi:Rhodopirellula transposase DDE domain
MDAKATVKVGPFARGGKNRVLTKAADHDFEAQATVTPVGIFLPASDEFFLYGVASKVTSDCLVDRLVQWWESVKERFSHIKTLVINLDNGPENHSHRTQFMQRLLEFAQKYQITIRLAYYPPYHSKYNPVERGTGHFRAPLEWGLARFCGGRHPICRNDDLEKESSDGRIGDDCLSNRSETDKESHARGGNPPPTMAFPGEMVRRYSFFARAYQRLRPLKKAGATFVEP